MDCLFCKIVNGEIPCYKIYEDEVVIAFLDINPKTNGHTLIVPKKHTLDLESIDIDTATHIIKVAKEISQTLVKKLNADGIALLQNNGILQEVKHFHLHLIPSYKIKIANSPVEEIYNILK